jgi:hypothetical protein
VADASWAPVLLGEAVAGRDHVAAFFGEPVGAEITVRILSDRASLDAHWQRIWRDPGFRSECWMIASGDAGGIVLLSPGAWARDSCGHDGADAVERRGVVFHEVVHVHHARRNTGWPSLGGIGWLVEGLAVHASGQHDAGQRARVRDAVAAGGGPRRLSEVLPAGYEHAGSLVAWIDRTHGRPRVRDLLAETTESGVLLRLGTTEEALVAAWRRAVAAGE